VKSKRYWRARAAEHIAMMEAYAARYHEGIQDTPRYVKLAWLTLRYLLAPRPKPKKTKEARV